MRDFHGLTQTETILQMLRDAGERGVPNYLLTEVSLQYNARIWDLRKLGWDIQRKRVSRNGRPSNTYLYFLKGAPTPAQPLAKTEVRSETAALFALEPTKPIQKMDAL